MKDDCLSDCDSQEGSSLVTITLPSITIVKTEYGYEFMRSHDQSYQHLIGCKDLWDAIDNILHHFCLTPSILAELQSLRQKSAELHWDDRAIAEYYGNQAITREEAAKASSVITK